MRAVPHSQVLVASIYMVTWLPIKDETRYRRDENGPDAAPPANSGRTPCKHSRFITSLPPQAANRQTLQAKLQANTPGKHSRSITGLPLQATNRQTLHEVLYELATPGDKQANDPNAPRACNLDNRQANPPRHPSLRTKTASRPSRPALSLIALTRQYVPSRLHLVVQRREPV
jgi:hypothetical protein